jgi:hypothetical protein
MRDKGASLINNKTTATVLSVGYLRGVISYFVEEASNYAARRPDKGEKAVYR